MVDLARTQQPAVPVIFVADPIDPARDGAPLRLATTDDAVAQRLERLVRATKQALFDVAARREQHYFQAIVENSADGIALLAPDGTILYGSPATTRILGYTPAEFVDHNAFRLIHEDDQALVLRRITDFLQQPGVRLAAAARLRHKDGAWRWLEAIFTNLLAAPDVRAILTNYRDITEHKQAEETLRASEAGYKALLEQAADGIVILDAALVLEDANSVACAMLGYHKDDLLGRRLTELVVSDDLAQRPHNWAGLWTKAVLRNERLMRCQDGTTLPVETSTKLMDDGRIQIIIRDITERKQAEAALRRHTLTFETIHDAIYITDAAGLIVDCNPAAELLSGYTRAESLGASVGLLHKPEDSPRLMAQIEEALGRWGRWAGELNFVRKNGSEGISETVIVAMLDQQGKLFATISTNHDITEHKQAEEAVRASEQKFRAVFENTLDPIYIIDNACRFVSANRAAARLSGLEQSDLAQRGLADFPDFTATSGLEKLWQQFLQQGKGSGELSFRTPDGELREVEYYSKADFIPGYHLAVVHDITERKRAAKARLAREAAEQANQAKSEFLSRMSHELRTPLNAILGFRQLLGMDDLGQRQRESVDFILAAGHHLLALVDAVLDIVRVEQGNAAIESTPLLLAPTIRQSVEAVRPLALARAISLDVELPDAVRVVANSQRLTQVIVELLTNAVKYSQPSGRVRVDTFVAGASRIWVRVSDSGPGLSTEQLAHIFAPFERLGVETAGITGTGLGLVLARTLVEAMHGSIGVESTLGAGSTFWVELALADDTVAQHRGERVHLGAV